MKPYIDKNCKCFKIEKNINKRFPDCDWCLDEACGAWGEKKKWIKR